MATCNPCIKINPLPECINSEAYNPYYFDGLTFTDIETNMYVKLMNVATGNLVYIDFITDDVGLPILEIQDLFPLMDHVYTMEFFNKETGNPANFTITNLDSTTSTGCCLTFGINKNQIDNNGQFIASTQLCTA